MRAFLAVLAIALIPTIANAHVTHKLTWRAVVRSADGMFLVSMGEQRTFPSKAACEAFADSHKERALDYIRGALNAPWELDITAGYECEPVEYPA